MTTSLSAGVARSPAGCGCAGAAAGRAHRLGVPDDRADLARAGVARRRVVHVPRARSIPLEHFERVVDDGRRSCRSRTSAIATARGSTSSRSCGSRTSGAYPCCSTRYQSIGSLPIDVKALGVDFLAGGVLKYLLGSAGLGFLYCRRELSGASCRRRPAGSPIVTSSRWTSTTTRRRRTRARFQSGTPPVPSIYAGIAGIELMQEIGVAETQKHVRALNASSWPGSRSSAVRW